MTSVLVSAAMAQLMQEEATQPGISAMATAMPGTDNGTRMGEESASGIVDCTVPNTFVFILYSIIMGGVCTSGLVGNTVSLIVLQRDRASPVASFLLQSLAVADNTLLASWMFHYSLRELTRVAGFTPYHQHPAWLYARVANFHIVYMAQTATVWLTVVLAVNRLIAVCSPYSSPRLCKLAYVRREVAAVALFAVAFNTPRFFEMHVVKGNGTNSYELAYTTLRDNSVYAFVYGDILYYVMTFVLPLLILGAVNTRIIVAYRATRMRKRSMQTASNSTSGSSGKRATENNVTLVMIIIVVIFMLCLAPARLVQLVTSYEYSSCTDVRFYLIHLSNCLEMLNSSVNFVIYVVYHKRFRHLFFDLCCCRQPVGPLASCCCCYGTRTGSSFSLVGSGAGPCFVGGACEGTLTTRRMTGTTTVDGETRGGGAGVPVSSSSSLVAQRYAALAAAHASRSIEHISLHGAVTTTCGKAVETRLAFGGGSNEASPRRSSAVDSPPGPCISLALPPSKLDCDFGGVYLGP